MTEIVGWTMTALFVFAYTRSFLGLYRLRRFKDKDPFNNLDAVVLTATCLGFIGLLIYGYLLGSFIAAINGAIGAVYCEMMLILHFIYRDEKVMWVRKQIKEIIREAKKNS